MEFMSKLSKFLLLLIVFNAPIVILALDSAPAVRVSRVEEAAARSLIGLSMPPARHTPVSEAGRATVSALAWDDEAASSPVGSVKESGAIAIPVFSNKVGAPVKATLAPGTGAKRINFTTSYAAAVAAPVARKKARLIVDTGDASGTSAAPIKPRSSTNHSCSVCGKGFRYPKEVSEHAHVHTGARPYVCPHAPKGCDFGTTSNSNLHRHLRSKTACKFKDLR